MDPTEINEAFKKVYEKLYGSEIDPRTTELNNFLANINIPKKTEVIKGEIEKDIYLVELSVAIDSIKGGKTPGPDRLPIEIYKMFKQTDIATF